MDDFVNNIGNKGNQQNETSNNQVPKKNAPENRSKSSSNNKIKSPEGNQKNNSTKSNTSPQRDENNKSDINKVSDTQESPKAPSKTNNTPDDKKQDAAEKIKDKTEEAAQEAGGGQGGAPNPKDSIEIAKNVGDGIKETAHLYDNQEDGTTGTLNDVKDAAVGVAKTAVKVATKNYAGAVKEVTKIIPSILRLVLPLLLIGYFAIILFLSAPAMIWDHITEKYEDWCYTQACDAIDTAISDAAWGAVDDIADNINNSIDSFNLKELSNKYYANYQGDGYIMDTSDGGKFSISMQTNNDGTHENAVIKYVDKDNKCYEFTYLNADITTGSESSSISYAEVVNSFTKYRENLCKKNKKYEVFNRFTQTVKQSIKTLGVNVLQEISTNFPTFIQECKKFIKNPVGYIKDAKNNKESMSVWKDLENENDFSNSDDVWGLTDTSALYYYMTQDDVLNRLYNCSFYLNDSKEAYSSIDLSKADCSSDYTSDGYSKYYKITIDVNTFDGDDVELDDGQAYSSKIRDIFDLTDDEMKEVCGKTTISNAILQASTENNEEISDDFSAYLSNSPSKCLYEKLVGKESYLENLIDNGYFQEKSADDMREAVAQVAKSYVNQNISFMKNQGIIRTEDQFADAFVGTSKYIDKNGKEQTETFSSSDIPLGEDGVFATYVFAKTLNAGQVSLKPRRYLFPEIYSGADGKKRTKTDAVLLSSDDYYTYFQKYAKKRYYETSGTDVSVNIEQLKKAFTKNSPQRLQKGDLVFLNYYDAPSFILPGVSKMTGYRAYQIGIVTGIDYDKKVITLAIYNYDDDMLKQTILDSRKSWITNRIGKKAVKVTSVNLDCGNGKITPMNDSFTSTVDWIGSKLGTDWGIDQLVFITGYAKPNYDSYADAYNKEIQKLKENYEKTIAAAASDTGDGTLGYPVDNKNAVKHSSGYPSYSSGSYHGGRDISVPVGTKVYACADGKVVESKALKKGGKYYSYGEYIKIRHYDGRYTIYAHLSKRSVRTGDTVIRGQIIGLSGNTGNSSGPHLHLEYRTNADKHSETLDPKKYITDGKGQNVKISSSNTPVKKGVSYKGVATHYCACKICNGSNSGTTATGKKIKNGMKNPYYVAANWLPLNSKIRVTINGKSQIYTVVDRGGKDFNNVGRIDIFTPEGHSTCYELGRNDCVITILSVG